MHAVSLALKLGARLTILHVVEHAHNRSQADSELRELRRSIPDSVHDSWRIDELVVHGAVADEIIDVTRALSADLLVLGFRRDFLSEDTRDAIVSSVVRDIASDVLVVPGAAIVEPSVIGVSGLEAGSGSPPS
jgi:nucleotide-binding universal stress UspA family protein